ncbi:MAG: hypothetical protein IT280_13090 [Ignavibacteria bacterium]|nr:hypothetical protein [Ignavibacteria bacterium]
MTITTKFNIGDTAFYLANNGVIKSSKVIEVIASVAAKDTELKSAQSNQFIKYRLQDALGITRPEEKLFNSDKELTESLVSKPEAPKVKNTNS